MCGLFFLCSTKLNNYEFGRKNYRKLSHRGPDKSIILSNKGNEFFLSINILSLTRKNDNKISTNEFKSGDRYLVALNGEIYNYKLLAKKFNIQNINSDTELISKLLYVVGIEKLFDLIDGMYSIIIYDNYNNKAYFKRDTIGEKRLFYYDYNNTFVVSSEVSHLKNINLSTTLNKNTIKNYFFTRHLMPLQETCYNEIKEFEPGTLYQYNLDKKILKIISKKRIESYISHDTYNYLSKLKYEEIKLLLKDLFIENANYLTSPYEDFSTVSSGGLDSTIVTESFLSSINNPNFSLALNFPGKDELPKNLIKYYKNKNHTFYLKNFPLEKFKNNLSQIYNYIHSPLPTHSFVSQYYLSKIVKLNNVKCLVGGDGGDEIFGGYELYKNIEINEHKKEKTNPSPYSSITNYSRISDIFTKDDSYYDKINKTWLQSLDAYSFLPTKENIYQSLLFSDVRHQLEQVGLLCSDVMSMQNSIETRTFFVSSKILSVALNLPIRYKFKIIKDKITETRPIIKDIYKMMTGLKVYSKQGFAGYPNESGKLILNKDKFNIINDLFNYDFNSFSRGRDLEWKIINVELFLKNCIA